jgi:glycosyl-4,4'-diaponeurosporenoate acyltransferase
MTAGPLELPAWGLLLANVAGAAAIHTVTGYAAHRLPLARLQRDGWLLRPRRVEDGGRLYARRLRIRAWKDRLPEAGALFEGGVSKRRLTVDVERFVAETRRAEIAHWLALAGTPLFALWNPPMGVVLMAAYATAANVPCIAVQRFNRQRAQRVVAHRAGISGGRSGRAGP